MNSGTGTDRQVTILESSEELLRTVKDLAYDFHSYFNTQEASKAEPVPTPPIPVLKNIQCNLLESTEVVRGIRGALQEQVKPFLGTHEPTNEKISSPVVKYNTKAGAYNG